MRVEQRGKSERSEIPKGRGVWGSTNGTKKLIANGAIRVILELYLRIYIYLFIFKSGATPVFPEQLAAMHRSRRVMKLRAAIDLI